jgi:predicted AAA+ superfamily ATPase
VRPYSLRLVDRELDELLAGIAAIALEGPKGVGKTATAERRVRTVVRLDDPARQQLAAADPALLLKSDPPILLDEWQHVPAVWDAVRRAVDDGAAPGQFLLAGSAAPLTPPTHSGAGRIVTLRMRPLSLAERALGPTTVSLRALLTGARAPLHGETTVGLAQYTHEILASGLPGLRGLTGRTLRAQLDGYLSRIVDRDILEQGVVVRRPDMLRRWMTAYAAATATTASYEKIRRAANAGDDDATTARNTTAGYREVLERLWILEPLPGWLPSRNPLSNLAQAPRHHLVDPALAARLLGVSEGALLHGERIPFGAALSSSDQLSPRDGTLLGQLFESLVTLSVRVYAQLAEARVRHLRTTDGRHEVDLIIERADQRIVACEVKLAAHIDDRDVRHLRWLQQQLGEDLLDAAIITTGSHAYRRPDGIAVIPAALLTA